MLLGKGFTAPITGCPPSQARHKAPPKPMLTAKASMFSGSSESRCRHSFAHRRQKRLEKALSNEIALIFHGKTSFRRVKPSGCERQCSNLKLHILVNARNYLYLTDFCDSVISAKRGARKCFRGRKLFCAAAINQCDFNHVPVLF
jgi:hypothetical protein